MKLSAWTLAAAALMALPAAAQSGGPGDRFLAALAACTERHDYDPETVSGLGLHQLDPNERAWLACAHVAVGHHMVPASRHPEMYDLLLREQIALTDRVEDGEITRAERQARVDEIVASIVRQEEASRKEDELKARKLREIAVQQRVERRRQYIDRQLQRASQTNLFGRGTRFGP